MRDSFTQRFLFILGSKSILLLLGILTTPLLVRLLGSSQYGDYAFILSMLAVTMIVVNAGIFDGVRKYIAEDRDTPNWTENVVRYYLGIGIALALMGALVYAVSSRLGLSDYLFRDGFRVYLYLSAILIIGRQMDSIGRGCLMGLGLESRSEPINTLKKLTFSATAVYLVYAGHGIVGVLVGHIVSTTVASILSYIILIRHVEIESIFHRLPKSFPKKQLLSFNYQSVILILLTASLYHVDIIFLRLLTGTQTTGYYKAALVVAEFLWFIPTVIQMVLLPSSSELWSNGNVDRITKLASRVTRYNLSMLVLLITGLAALAQDFVPIYYGEGFTDAVTPLLLLLPGALGFAVARPIFAIGQGKGQLRTLIVATGTASLINLCMNALLIPRYGMTGAAIATSVGYGSMLLLHVIAARRIGFNPISDLRLLKMLAVASATAIVVFVLSYSINSSVLSLLVIPPVGFTVYTVLSLRLSVVDLNEVSPVIEKLPGPIRNLVKRCYL